MSFLFPSQSPQPTAVPVSPMASDNAQAQAQRDEAARQVLIQQKAAGRASTIVGGMKIAEDEQQQRGMLSQRKRAASRDIVG